MGTYDVMSNEEKEPQAIESLSGDYDEIRLAQDAAWVQQALLGDTQALSNLYERYINRIYLHFRYKVGDTSEAEALTAETFTRAFEALKRGRYIWKGKSFGSWLFGIAANVLRERKRELRQAPMTGELGEFEHNNALSKVDILEILVQQETFNECWQLVRELTREEQVVLFLRYSYELTYTEIAQYLKRSNAACKQLHYRAISKLRDKIKEQATARQNHG